jgi:hypothetical protein
VLEDRHRPGGREALAQAAEDRHVLGGLDVMEDAGREDQVVAFRRGRRGAGRIVGDELRRLRKAASRHRQALFGDVDGGDRGARESLVQVRGGAADAAAEVQDAPGGEPQRAQAARDLRHLVAGEVVGALAGHREVGLMGREIFLGELVELGDVHRFAPR